jgi:cell wall-associated NlpC family hydrolase
MEVSDLLRCPFAWGGRWSLSGHPFGLDCYGLVLEVRRRLGFDSLPGFEEIYQEFDRSSLPPRKILELANTHGGRVDRPVPGDIAVLEGKNGTALGCYIGSHEGESHAVILFGEDELPVVEPDYNLPNLLGYWRPRVSLTSVTVDRINSIDYVSVDQQESAVGSESLSL